MMAADFEEEARRLEQDAARCNDDRHQPPQMNGAARTTLGARTDRSPTGETPHHRPEPVASLIGCVIRW